MATNMPGARRRNRWSAAIWGAAAVLVLLPAVAMRMHAPGVDWSGVDFAVAAALLASACGAYEWATRMSGDTLMRAGAAAAVLGGLGTVWANVAVGLVGVGANGANLAFMGVVGVAIVAAWRARLRAAGRARAMLLTAGVHVLVGAVAAVVGAGGAHDDPAHVLGVTAFFAMPWRVSAARFRNAARREVPR